MKNLISILICAITIQVHGATIQESLYIIRDSISVSNGSNIPYLTFNSNSSDFYIESPLIILDEGDSLKLWIVNEDSIDHSFEITNVTGSSALIPQNDSVLVELKFNNSGGFIYRSNVSNSDYAYCGLSGTIIVKNHNHPSFYWNLREHDSLFNTSIMTGNNVNWSNYNPKFFTINGNSHPNINSDSLARINGNINDTIILYISNCGRSLHSIHFHGFHLEIINSSFDLEEIGRFKDTFPIRQQESLILRLIPDKLGEYPVHDHNLVALSGSNIYPNGMLLTMLIQQ